MKKLNTIYLPVTTAAGAGTNSVMPACAGYIDKLVVVVPATLTADIVVEVVSDNSIAGVETIYSKTGVGAGTQHLYPRAPTIKSDGTALTSLPYVRPLFWRGDSLRITLANSVVDGQPSTGLSVQVMCRYETVEV